MNLLQQNTCTAFACVHIGQIRSGVFIEVRRENIVAENDGESILSGKVFTQSDCLRNAPRLILYAIRQVDTESSATAEKVYHVPHMFRARHDCELFNSSAPEPHDRVVNHRVLPDRQ